MPTLNLKAYAGTLGLRCLLWAVEGTEPCIAYELKSKLLKGGYVGDYIGE